MNRLNIRCCCRPEKVLGSLPWPCWPADLYGTHRTFRLPPVPSTPMGRIQTVTVEIRRFVDPAEPRWAEEWAIYGDDKPIGFWQSIPGYAPP